MLTVHVRVNDAATGQPTPVRLRLLDAEGGYHAPFGRLAEFATSAGQDVGGNLLLDNNAWAFIDGTCEIRLPIGALQVALSRGPEYTPVCHEINLRPGQISLRLGIERWIDLRTLGWYSGDLRAHELTPQAALLEGAAEGLAVVQVLAREHGPAPGRPSSIPGILAFSGTVPALENPHCLVAVNTLNEHPVLGRIGLLDCHRVVYPLRFGAPDHLDDWSVADWCDQCHRKRGLVTWPDLPRLKEESLQGEALAALILGKIDAWEVAALHDPDFRSCADYYRLLDCGLRVPLVGASGKDSNLIPLGNVRTYARLAVGEEFSLLNWLQAIRAGRTFVTAGPLLSLTVEPATSVAGLASVAGSASVVKIRPGERLRVRAEARSNTPLVRLEVLAGGRQIAQRVPTGDQLQEEIDTEIELQESTWIVARCLGSNGNAHTSPMYVEVEGRPLPVKPEASAPLIEVLDRTLAWVEKEARCELDRQREHLRGILTTARAALLREGNKS